MEIIFYSNNVELACLFVPTSADFEAAVCEAKLARPTVGGSEAQAGYFRSGLRDRRSVCLPPRIPPSLPVPLWQMQHLVSDEVPGQ